MLLNLETESCATEQTLEQMPDMALLTAEWNFSILNVTFRSVYKVQFFV